MDGFDISCIVSHTLILDVFRFYFVALLPLLLSLVFTLCFGSGVVSSCVLAYICVWFAKILIDIFKVSRRFSDLNISF